MHAQNPGFVRIFRLGGERLASGFGGVRGKIAELSKAEESELADATVRSQAHPELEIVKSGWLEKKGGSTVILPDGTLQKERNFKKGGRRNWTPNSVRHSG